MPTTPARTNRENNEHVGPRSADEFDALADLFLGEDETREPFVDEDTPPARSRSAKSPAAPALELLVQGHLPVRAAPWASQYARLRATTTQAPVALVRLTGGNLSVEIFGSESEEFRDDADAALAVTNAARIAKHVIVQLDEVHQAAFAGDPRVASVTVLGGANEAAVVATYRTLKGLSGVFTPAAEGDEPPTDLQVAFVTTEEGADRDALERLRRASAVFLDRPLAHAGTVGKIGPTGAVPLFRGECQMGPGRLLDLLTNTAPAEGAPHSRPAARRPVPSRDLPTPSAPGSPDHLSRFIPGLKAINARCPDDPTVELAVDKGDRLHLLRQDNDGRAVERLVSVSAWAVKHAALLSAAGLGADFSHPPAMHLFTSEPKSIRHLLDADVRVHLLATVGAEWYCTELN
ncbi:MAG: hypothetical protein JNK58_02050 [Phycisphaerae bacterium]|nr:hypothetical protein [Phycisphaerae bacterium]